MAQHELAGKPATVDILINPAQIMSDYDKLTPDVSVAAQCVSFGTSGHRGRSSDRSFNTNHILAITQAICEYRASAGTTGPLFIGMDSHFLSGVAQQTALCVLAANGVEVRYAGLEGDSRFTPTPTISRAILSANEGKTTGLADGIVITPSHNPPADGGFKYNGTDGGPADTDVTGFVENRANEILADGCKAVKCVSYIDALAAPTTQIFDFVTPYVEGLANIIDFAAIRDSKIKIGVDPLGGASLGYWKPIAKRYGIDITVVNDRIDYTFSFMTVDHDGKIRMDCSSPWAMASLVGLKDKFDIAFGCDPDADRHGIVTPKMGLMNPNHYLAVAANYLFATRTVWSKDCGIGKTMVSSSLIDRVAKKLGRKLVEVPVGFKWFVPGLRAGTIGMGGEESAGASLLQMDGSTWTTDKDGLVMGLLAAEIRAKSGKDLADHYYELTAELGAPVYTRVDRAVTPAQKKLLKSLSPEAVAASTLAGDPIIARETRAPSNNAEIGGLKVSTDFGWFAARPSGTEDVYKIYAESFRGQDHLNQIVEEAAAIVNAALGGN